MILDTETVCKHLQYRIILYITDLLFMPLQKPHFLLFRIGFGDLNTYNIRQAANI